MVGMGLTLSLRDFREVAVAPRATLFGTVAQILLLPLIAFAIAALLSLPPELAVGLVLIAACPGGTTSNLFTFIGRGDVALSIVLTVIASLLTIISLPLFVNWAMQLYFGEGTSLQLPVLNTVLTLFAIVLVPLMIGMLIRVYRPRLAARAERLVAVFGFLVLFGVITAIVINLGEGALAMLRAAGAAAILLNLAGIVLGLAGGRMLGLSRARAFTVAIELGIKNGTLGLLIALSMLQSPEISVPAAAYSLLMFVFGFLLLGYSRITRIGATAAGDPVA
jgi:BASS family bile acid:Na+ symporter